MKDCVSCVHEYLSPMSDTCRECGIAMLNYEEAKPKPITNYDRIRAKSVEEMAELLTDVGVRTLRLHRLPVAQPVIEQAKEDWILWLKQEADK